MSNDNTRKPLNFTALLAIALLALAPAWALCQEADPDEAPSATAPGGQQEPAPADTPPAPAARQGETRASPPSDDPFRPSETISEDLSVPFPVDI